MRFRTILAAVALALVPGSISAQGPQVRLFRTWLPPDVTVVDGFFRVDGDLLGTGAQCAYVATLAVRDSTGATLVHNEWTGQCPPPRDGEAQAALETFQFAVKPAAYTVEVSVRPEGHTQLKRTTTVRVSSLPKTAVSDLVLGARTGWIGDVDSTAAWTLRRGDLGVQVMSETVVAESAPNLAYYVELYPENRGGRIDGRVMGAIRRADGRIVHEVVLQRLDGVAVSFPVAGNLSLEGLAPGDYRFETRIEMGDTTITRAESFRMISAALAAGPRGGWFAALTESQLRDLFAPVVVLLDSRDRSRYERLAPDGKRRFLAEFFGVEPTPPGASKPPNVLDEYLERVRVVRERFGEKAGRAAWETDRGRVYLLRGEPTSRFQRPVSRDGSSPYEIWYYTIASGYTYLFVDETRLGDYRLIFSTDPLQATLPDWDRRVGADAIDDLIRLGVRIRPPGQ